MGVKYSAKELLLISIFCVGHIPLQDRNPVERPVADLLRLACFILRRSKSSQR